jgi:hypothetical protein
MFSCVQIQGNVTQSTGNNMAAIGSVLHVAGEVDGFLKHLLLKVHLPLLLS